MNDFDEQMSLCFQSDAAVASFLEYLGDFEGARELRDEGARAQGLGDVFSRPWKLSTHVYGFIGEGLNDGGLIPVEAAIKSEPDKSLVGEQIKVTLDGFRVAKYPGFGRHKVLFDFSGRDQAGAQTQDLRFASVLTVGNGESAAISGMPIFTGLTVPGDGLSFKVRTALISSEGDEAIVDVLQSSLFKEGLKLMSTVQPALSQLVALAGGVTQNLIKRYGNEQVQEFELGLDFTNSRTSARLRRGSYVVVQVPGEGMWKWDKWSLDPNTMALVDAEGNIAPYNTIVFAVSASTSTVPSSAIRAEGQAALDANAAASVVPKKKAGPKKAAGSA